jgi:ABC-type branched-subunit amino acid transport system substrate-binding protein
MVGRSKKRVLVGLVTAAALSVSMFAGVGSVSAATEKEGARCDKEGDVSNGYALMCEKKGATLTWVSRTLPRGTYKVGSEMLLSGPSAFAGVPMDKGVQKAVEEINKSEFLGKGAKIELITRDSAGKADVALAAVNEFVANKVSGIICCALSSIAGAISQVAANNATPVIIDAAVLPGLAKPPYIHRTVIMTGARNGIQWQSAQAMVKVIKAKTVAIPETSDNQGMVADAVMYKEAVTAAGATNVVTVKTQAADTDLSGAASQIIAANPDLVIPAMLGGPASRLIKALRDRGYKGRIVGNYGLSDATNFAIAGASLAGVVMPVTFDPSKPVNKLGRDIVKWWKSGNGGQLPSAYPGMGYTAAWYLAIAMKNSGDGTPANVAKALNKIGRMDSVYGTVRFNKGQIELGRTAKPVFKEWQADGTQKDWNGK